MVLRKRGDRMKKKENNKKEEFLKIKEAWQMTTLETARALEAFEKERRNIT